MLQTIALYLFLGWFIKLDNKIYLIIRISLAAVFGMLWLISFFVCLTLDDEVRAESIMCICLTLLFALRIIFDVKKLLKVIKADKEKKTQERQTQQQ